ncbi:hypothetical protein BASA62_000457 [Batrachochytrium salamandrivorans]|nr:hypothetical protein BASA62_000457 [Batrachochytrium salamandrivorans]
MEKQQPYEPQSSIPGGGSASQLQSQPYQQQQKHDPQKQDLQKQDLQNQPQYQQQYQQQQQPQQQYQQQQPQPQYQHQQSMVQPQYTYNPQQMPDPNMQPPFQTPYPGMQQQHPLAPGEVPTSQPYFGGPIVCPFCHQSGVPIARTFANYSAKTNQLGFCLGATCCVPCIIFPMRAGGTVQKTVLQCSSCQTFIQ